MKAHTPCGPPSAKCLPEVAPSGSYGRSCVPEASRLPVHDACFCDCIMAPQHAAAFGAGAVRMGAALAVNIAVQGLAQVLSVALEEDDEPEDQTEVEWAID